MKTSNYVIRVATPELMQTFARELGAADDADARAVGFASAAAGYQLLAANSRDKWALVEHGSAVDRVLAVAGVNSVGQLWLHTAPALKSAGIGALKRIRVVVGWLLEKYGELRIDVDTQRPELVRMADWLGFRVSGPALEKLGRTFHPCVLRGPSYRRATA